MIFTKHYSLHAKPIKKTSVVLFFPTKKWQFQFSICETSVNRISQAFSFAHCTGGFHVLPLFPEIPDPSLARFLAMIWGSFPKPVAFVVVVVAVVAPHSLESSLAVLRSCSRSEWCRDHVI